MKKVLSAAAVVIAQVGLLSVAGRADAPLAVAPASAASAYTWMVGRVPWFAQVSTTAHPNLEEVGCCIYSMKQVLWWWGIYSASEDEIYDYLDDHGESPDIGVWHPREAAYVFRDKYGLSVSYGTSGNRELIKYWVDKNRPVIIWVSTYGAGVASDHCITVVGYDDNYDWGPGSERGAFYVHDTSGAFVSTASPAYPTLGHKWDVPVPYDTLIEAWDAWVWDPDEFELPGSYGYIVAERYGGGTLLRGTSQMVQVLAPDYAGPGELALLQVQFNFETEGDLPRPGSSVFLRLEGASFVEVNKYGIDGTFNSAFGLNEQGDRVSVNGSRMVELSNRTLYRDIDTMVASGRALVQISAWVWIEIDDPPPEGGVVHLYYRGGLMRLREYHHQCPIHTETVADDRPNTVMPRVEHWIERYPDDVPHHGKDLLDYAVESIDIGTYIPVAAGEQEYRYSTTTSPVAEPSEVRLGGEVTVSGTLSATAAGGVPTVPPAGETVTLTYSTLTQSLPTLLDRRDLLKGLRKGEKALEPISLSITREVTTGGDGAFSDTFVPERVGHWWVQATFAGEPPYYGATGYTSFDVLPEEATNATITLDQPVYGLTDTVLVTVADPDLNVDPDAFDWVSVDVTSTSDTTGIDLVLVETGENTGVFQAELTPTPSESSGTRLHVTSGDTITVTHRDLLAGDIVAGIIATAVVVPTEVLPEQRVTRGDFSIRVGQSYLEIPRGGTASITLYVDSDQQGATVTLGLTRPLGIDAYFPSGHPPSTVTLIASEERYTRIGQERFYRASTSLVVEVGEKLPPPGTYTLRVRGVSGEYTDTKTIRLDVVEKKLYPRWDINEDGVVDYKDVAMLGAHFWESTVSPYPRWEVNEDGKVDYDDLDIIKRHYGETTVAAVPEG